MSLPGFVCDACRMQDESNPFFDPRCATCMTRGERGYRLELWKRASAARGQDRKP